MTEQEAKELQIGDVVQYAKSGALFVISCSIKGDKRAAPVGREYLKVDFERQCVVGGHPAPIKNPADWNIYSQVLSRQGKPVDKL